MQQASPFFLSAPPYNQRSAPPNVTNQETRPTASFLRTRGYQLSHLVDLVELQGFFDYVDNDDEHVPPMMLHFVHDRKDSHSHDEKIHHLNHDENQKAYNAQDVAKVVVVVSSYLQFQLHGDLFHKLEKSQHLAQDDDDPP